MTGDHNKHLFSKGSNFLLLILGLIGTNFEIDRLYRRVSIKLFRGQNEIE